MGTYSQFAKLLTRARGASVVIISQRIMLLFDFKSRKYKSAHNNNIIWYQLFNRRGFVEMNNFQKNYYAS